MHKPGIERSVMNPSTLAISSVTVSADLQITIPAAVGQSLGLSEGQRFQVVRYQDRIELIPIRPVPSLRGFLKGMDITLDRDADRL